MKKIRLFSLVILFCLLLTCAALAEGSAAFTWEAGPEGITLTGSVDKDVQTLTLPIQIDGQPVVAVAPGAFSDCAQLQAFQVEAEHPAFVTHEGLLIHRESQTLVAVPVGYGRQNIALPEGLAAIGERAFSQYGRYLNLLVPASVRTIENEAFADMAMGMCLFTLGDQDAIGEDVFLRNGGASIYYKAGSLMEQYVQQRQLAALDMRAIEDTIPAMEPVAFDVQPPETAPARPADAMPFELFGMACHTSYDLILYCDLILYEEMEATAVEIQPLAYWRDGACPAEPEGLYGAGITESELTLHYYDGDGVLLGWQSAAPGNFTFGMDGAASIVVSGGSKTRLLLSPFRPTQLTPGTDYYLGSGNWQPLNGGLMQCILVPVPYATISLDYRTDYLAALVSGMEYATGTYYPQTMDPTADYLLLTRFLAFPQMKDNVAPYILRVQQNEIRELDGLRIISRAESPLTEEMIDRLATIADQVWDTLSPTLATDTQRQPITYNIQLNIYPTAIGTTVNLSESDLIFDTAADLYAIVHETVHATDYLDSAAWELCPMAWHEGIAEYYGAKVLKTYDPSFTCYSTIETIDFLSPAEKADFANYFYFHTTHENQYEIGWAFISFLVETYGQEKLQAFHDELNARAAAAMELEPWNLYQPEVASELFYEALYAVMGQDVMDRFVSQWISE